MPGKGAAALYNAAHRRPKRPTLLAPDISRDIEAVLALALAPNPRDRFQTVDALRTSFDKAVAGHLSGDILNKAKAIAWARSST